MMNCFSEIVRAEGIRGLYKGIAPSLIKAYLSTAVTLSIYDSLCNHFRQTTSE
jgi:solute carrier family 25 thiamine pyrophosphate transporter 19